MSDLISDLLDYSRVGRTSEPLQPVDVQHVVGEALENLDAAVRESGARVHVGPLPTVAGVRTQLLQLFQNLLANAVKFHSAGPPVVDVRSTQQDGCWQFAVEDNGIGIEPQHFDRIFQVFHRLHGREYPGTGIGLALCKKIVELHGGRIWLTSEVGRGTTFFFTLASKPPKPA
jgi:light-regulated signal transduction histidine kinase (bacteriophytochrome)